MKSKNYLGHMCAVIGIPALTCQSNADSVVPGSSCHSITPSQATKMEWREQGLKNSAAQEYWVIVLLNDQLWSPNSLFRSAPSTSHLMLWGCNATYGKFMEGGKDKRPSLAAPSQRESSRPCNGQLVLDTKSQSSALRASCLTV